MAKRVLCITGPTAAGKTALALALCRGYGGEVVSADSMQVYRGMDIGTAKPTEAERAGVPHHMMDVADPSESYSVARFVRDADRCVQDILERGRLPVIVGGTGLYVDALIGGLSFAHAGDRRYREELFGLYEQKGAAALFDMLREQDPESAGRLHENDIKRVIRALEVRRVSGATISAHNRQTKKLPKRYDALMIGLDYEHRADLYAAIEHRVDAMISGGLVDEVLSLKQKKAFSATSSQAIGYREILSFLNGDWGLDAAAEQIKKRTRNYAKRQLTWFRKNPDILWIRRGPDTPFEEMFKISSGYLGQNEVRWV